MARGADRRPETAPPVRRGRRAPAGPDRAHPARRRRGPASPAYGLRLAARHRPLRRRPATRTHPGNDAMIRFLQPLWLLAVVPVLVVAAAYVWRQLRRRAFAVRFTNVELLRTLAPKGLGWRRHVSAAAFL